ncbi:MAG: hypothetical protein JNM52_07255 [Betaproteobacteria bacterium]|nr:hypothetical protein [Betaproteobacteria bacterium]
MNDSTKPLSARRRWLAQATALGVLGPAGLSGFIQEALAKGDLSGVQGIATLTGQATVNGAPAKVGTKVVTGDKVATSANSSTVVVVGKDAYLLRDNTQVIFVENKEKPGVLDSVLIATGKVLSVFEKRPATSRVSIKAQNATIGIRGTGCYIEIQEKRTYFCLCYGEASISGPGMASAKTILTAYHENPLWLGEKSAAMEIESGPFINHTDTELYMLEKLCGRLPPFVEAAQQGKY